MVLIIILLVLILVVLLAIFQAITKPQARINTSDEKDSKMPIWVTPDSKVFDHSPINEPDESRFADGPKITPAKQKMIDKQMDRFLEQNPNIGFFREYPEYVNQYLERIDLSELDDALGKKGE